MSLLNLNKPKVNINAEDLVDITLTLHTFLVALKTNKAHDVVFAKKVGKQIKLLRESFEKQVDIKDRGKIADRTLIKYGVKLK